MQRVMADVRLGEEEIRVDTVSSRDGLEGLADSDIVGCEVARVTSM